MIGFVVAGIVTYLIISSYPKDYKNADEKALKNMHEWLTLANNTTHGNRETMCYNLVIQAGLILEKMQVISVKELQELMNKPGLSRSNFVLLIINLAPKFASTQNALRESFEYSQAKAYLADCIQIILMYGLYDDVLELPTLQSISVKACSEPMNWGTQI